MNTQELLDQIMNILGLSADERSQMIKQVDDIIQLHAFSALMEKLPTVEQNNLKQQLANASAREQQAILIQVVTKHYSPDELKNVYIPNTAKKIIPDYVETLLKSANDEQRAKVYKLLESVIQ
jgi:hypothetical protein